VVAFAITAGGALLIGIDARARDVRGVADPRDEEERLANLISE
jgi:predicted HTH transcriptional regulator